MSNQPNQPNQTHPTNEAHSNIDAIKPKFSSTTKNGNMPLRINSTGYEMTGGMVNKLDLLKEQEKSLKMKLNTNAPSFVPKTKKTTTDETPKIERTL